MSIRNTLYAGGLLSRGAYFWEGAYYPDYTVFPYVGSYKISLFLFVSEDLINSNKETQTISIAWDVASRLKSMNIPFKGQLAT